MTEVINLKIDPDKLSDDQFEKLKIFLMSIGYYNEKNNEVIEEEKPKKRWPQWPWKKGGD